jgi:ParB/RepB/Spo0J family partition protein
MATDKIQVVVTGFLRPSKSNPRVMKDAASYEELRDSIKAKGILDPLIVRPDGDGYEIVCGHRRAQAAKDLDLQDVPCIVRNYDDAEAQEVALIENLQRSTIHPLDEGEAFRHLLSESNEVDKLAARVGKSVRYVSQRLRLAELDPKIKKAFVERKFGVEVANTLARISPALQKEVFTKAQRYGELVSPGRMEATVVEALRALKAVPWDVGNTLLHGGACSVCPKQSGAMTELFPELKKDARCKDPKCFDEKMRQHLVNERVEMKRGGREFVNIATQYIYQGDVRNKNILGTGMYQLVGKEKCEHIKPGLIVMGEDTGKWMNVCPERKCKVHWFSSVVMDESARRRMKSEREKRALETKVAERAATAIVERRYDRRRFYMTVAHAMIERMGFDAEKTMCRRLQIEPAKTSWGGKDYTLPLLKKMKTLNEKGLPKFLMEAAVAVFMEGRNIGVLAKTHSVSLSKIAASVKKEAQIKKPAKKKAKAKK